MTDFTLGPGPLTPEFEQVKSDIGIVENGNTATHAIPKGYYVIWKGDLYVAKTDISSGTVLSAASGGNLTAKTQGIGAEVAALNNKLATGVYVSDINNATEPNICYYSDSNSANRPSGILSWLLIRVIGLSGGYMTQLASEENVLNGRMWYRTKTASAWGDWHLIVNAEKIATYGATGAHTAGAKFTLSSCRTQKFGIYAYTIIRATAKEAYGNTDVVATVPDGYRPTRNTPSVFTMLQRGTDLITIVGTDNIAPNGNITEGFTPATGLANDILTIMFIYSME